MMIADSESPVVMTSKNGARKFFMPNRPLATPDYSSDSFCSVENDSSDRGSRNDNNNVNISNNSASRKNREQEQQRDSRIQKEQNIVMSDNDNNNNNTNKVENKESSNTNNYNYSYSSSSYSSENNNDRHDNDDENGENDVVMSNSAISSYQTSPLSFMSSFIRTNENSTTSTKKTTMATISDKQQQTIDNANKLTESNKKHEPTNMENENDSSNEYDGNDHIHIDEDDKEEKRNINDSTNDDNKEFAAYNSNNESIDNHNEHEHEESDNMDDMEDVITTSMELPENESNCEPIREVFVHSGENAPIKLHVNHPPIERQPLEPQDDYMYSKHEQEEEEEEMHQNHEKYQKERLSELWEEKHQEEYETEEDAPTPLQQKRKLSYKDKGHVEPLCPEQLVELRHFTPSNENKEMYKQEQTKQHEKPQQEYLSEQENIVNKASNTNSYRTSSSKEANSSATSASSAYSSESSIINNNDDENVKDNMKQMPSLYASSSSSVRHSESTSTESSHSLSSPLKVKQRKKVETITNVPDSRQVNKDQETNSNNTSEKSHSTMNTNSSKYCNSGNDSVREDKVSSNSKIIDKRKIGAKENNNVTIKKEEEDTVIGGLPNQIDKMNSIQFLHTKHLQEQKQLEKEEEKIQAQRGSIQRIVDGKQRTSVKETKIVSQPSINNEKKSDETKSGTSICNVSEEKVDDKTNVQGTKTSKHENRIRVVPLKTNSHITKSNMPKDITGVANDIGISVANTSSNNYKTNNSNDVASKNDSHWRDTKELQNEKVLPSTAREGSMPDIAHSNIAVSQNNHMQSKANAVINISRDASSTRNTTKSINTHEMSVNVNNGNENKSTKEEHKSVNKLHVDNVHVERLGQLVLPEHNITQLKPQNSQREQRVNRLHELLDRPDAHFNSKQSNGKIEPMKHCRQQQQITQPRNQRLERKVKSNNESRNKKSRQFAQGSALHLARQEKQKRDSLLEEHLPTIITKQPGKQSMSILLEPVADDMIDSRTYYFSVRAIPESSATQNADNSHYYSSSNLNVSTLPNINTNRPHQLHLEEENLHNIVNNQEPNYLTREAGDKRHVLSPLSRQRFRPYNITNANVNVLPPVQTNKLYKPKNKKQKMKKRKQRRMQANRPRIRRPLGLLDIPVLEITKYGPDPYAHVLRYNGF